MTEWDYSSCYWSFYVVKCWSQSKLLQYRRVQVYRWSQSVCLNSAAAEPWLGFDQQSKSMLSKFVLWKTVKFVAIVHCFDQNDSNNSMLWRQFIDTWTFPHWIITFFLHIGIKPASIEYCWYSILLPLSSLSVSAHHYYVVKGSSDLQGWHDYYCAINLFISPLLSPKKSTMLQKIPYLLFFSPTSNLLNFDNDFLIAN